LLLVLDSQHALQDEKLDKLSRSNREIVAAVSVKFGTLQSTINDYKTKSDRDDTKRHAETIAAILTTCGGETRTITGSSAAIFSTELSSSQRIATTFKETSKSDPLNENRLGIETQEFTDFTQQVLNAFHFQIISDLRAAIPVPHTDTFSWIFESPKANDRPWDSMDDWLKRGKGCYWLNGKSGSGKSTLIKFIEGNDRTRVALKQWAGSLKLITGSFFFWYAGTVMQKSQAGLLRTLLLDVLHNNRNWYLPCFPRHVDQFFPISTRRKSSFRLWN
jgi:hypothetical protein